MESKKTLACPVEEDSKTSKEESSKPEESQCELVDEGGETLPPFEASVTKESTDDTKLSKETNSDNQGNAGFFPALLVAIYFLSTHYVKAIWCYLMSGFLNAPHGPATRFLNRDKPRSNRPLYWWNQRFKGYKPSVGIATLFMLVTIPGVLGQCVGNGDVCLSLAQKGPDWFNKQPECLDVRCLNLSNGQLHLPPYFRDVQELRMDDMGNTNACDVLKNWPNLHKIDLYVKNIFPTDACNTSCVLPEVTVAVLHNTSTIPCDLTKVMPKLKSISFDQAPTSVPSGISPEYVTTTDGNMVNQEKDAGFGVGFFVGFVVCAVIGGVIVIAFVLCRSNKHQSCSKCPSPVRNGVSKTSWV